MSQCVVPNWNLRQQQIQDQDQDQDQDHRAEGDQVQHQHQHQHQAQEQGQGQCRSSHLQNHHLQDLTHFVSMSKDEEVAELTWENGQLTMNGFNGLLPPPPLKPTWARAGETLESIVHQATTIMMPHKQNQDDQFSQFLDQGTATMISQVHGAGKCFKSSGNERMGGPGPAGKRIRYVGAAVSEEIMGAGASASAGASANFCRENENHTNMTWGASFESPRSLNLMSRRTTKTIDDDSTCLGDSENREEIEEYYEEERETKEEISGRSHSINRRSRAAAVHNLSERRRRDRINQKMKTLQKLVPNASKTDKASMLDEVIDYLKQLQGQVHMMNAVRNNMNNMSQMMMTPMGMQQQMQMSLLARMGMGGVGLGMGMGMGMGGLMDINTMAAAAAAAAASSRAVQHPTPNNIPPHASLVLPSMIHMQNPTQNGSDHAQATRGASNHPFTDPYAAFLAQSMNTDLYNKMATLYREQVNQGMKQQNTGSSSPQVMSKGNNNMI